MALRQGLLEKTFLEGNGLGCYKQATHLNEQQNHMRIPFP